MKTHLLALKNPEETAAMGGQPAAHAHHGMRERLTALTQKMNQNLQHLQVRQDVFRWSLTPTSKKGFVRNPGCRDGPTGFVWSES